jgi:hypothetical protein
MMMRKRRTNFVPRAVATVGDDRIERVSVKDAARDEIRFSWWPNGRFSRNPLVITEDELLSLFREAIKADVFADPFLRDLGRLLNERSGAHTS